MFAYCIAYRSNIDHGEEGTDAYDVPLPSTEEDITEYAQGAIRTYLPQFGLTECLIQYKYSVKTPPPHAIRSG